MNLGGLTFIVLNPVLYKQKFISSNFGIPFKKGNFILQVYKLIPISGVPYITRNTTATNSPFNYLLKKIITTFI